METVSVRDYYDSLTSVDIGRIAYELFSERITEETTNSMLCDCPNHGSDSMKSLSISLDKQQWYCFGCGVGGDVLHLVEFVQTGVVSKNLNGSPLPSSHRDARDWLAPKAGLRKLSEMSLDDSQIKAIEIERKKDDQVKQIMTTLADHYCSILIHERSKEVLEWFKSKYAISEETIKTLRIGYAGRDFPVLEAIQNKYGYEKDHILSTATYRQGGDKLYPFFNNRIVFPYWQRGSVVFMTGRKTPWTPDNKYEVGKYKKLPIHNENDENKNHIARCINNSVLYNEDCLTKQPQSVVITEGITDCIALIQRGFDAISPATVRINGKDIARIIRKTRRMRTVYICNDNEKSGVGLQGAKVTAEKFVKERKNTKIMTLPLASGMEKIDVNQFFLEGASKTDFNDLMNHAKTLLGIAIEEIPADGDPYEVGLAVEEILKKIANTSMFEKEHYLKALKDHLGGKVGSVTQLRKEIDKFCKAMEKQEQNTGKMVLNSVPEGSCKKALQELRLKADLEKRVVDNIEVGEAIYRWMVENGVKFFKTLENRVFIYMNEELFWLNSPDQGEKDVCGRMLLELAGVVITTSADKKIIKTITYLALKDAVLHQDMSWMYTEKKNHTIYFNLNNRRHEIVKISPNKVEVVKNVGNADSIFLDVSDLMNPITYIDDVDIHESNSLLRSLITESFACDEVSAELIVDWLSCFLLMDFVDTKPLTRFTGNAESGKSSAMDFISTLLYGKITKMASTDAANYSDGARNPILFLENIEAKQMTDSLIHFLLTSSNDIVKRKRRSGTNTKVVSETTKCMVNSTGIDAFSGETKAMLTRTFVVDFHVKHKNGKDFNHSVIVEKIKANRDFLLSGLIKRTSSVLAMIHDGKHSQVLKLLVKSIRNHPKNRCNSYLALMYLMRLTVQSHEQEEKALENLQHDFLLQLDIQAETSVNTLTQSSPIAIALKALFNGYKTAKKLDLIETEENRIPRHVSDFIRLNQANFFDKNACIKGASGTEIFLSLKAMKRQYSIDFPYKNVFQFVQRMKNEMRIINLSGIDIQHCDLRSRRRVYDICME